MKHFQPKEAVQIDIIGTTFEGDYIQAVSGSEYAVHVKVDFEAKYSEVVTAAAQPVSTL